MFELTKELLKAFKGCIWDITATFFLTRGKH